MELDVFIDSRHCQSFGNITVPVHKHRWQVRLLVEDAGEESRGVVRYSKVQAAVTSALHPFDGVILNEVYPFDIIEPTHDNIAMYFFNTLEDTLAMMDLRLVEMNMWEENELIKRITERNPRLGEILRGEDILMAMRQDLPDQVEVKRNPLKNKLAGLLKTATRTI